MFNPDQFLEAVITDANSTSSLPVPVGEYIAVVKTIKAREWKGKNDPTQGGMILDVTWSIDDENVKAAMDRKEVTCRQSIMLDMSESGGLDISKGKNVGLGRLREALGLNVPGQPFKFDMIVGRPAKVSVAHRTDPSDTSKIYDEVKMVAKLA